MPIAKTEIAFSEIRVDVKNAVKNVEISVTKLDKKPETSVSVSGMLYQYIEVETKNLGNSKSATSASQRITF